MASIPLALVPPPLSVMVSVEGVWVSIMGVPVLSVWYVAEHVTCVVPRPLNDPMFVGGAPSQALPIAEVTTPDEFTLLGRRVNVDADGVDCQVMLSPLSVDSASPVTNCQPDAATPFEIRDLNVRDFDGRRRTQLNFVERRIPRHARIEAVVAEEGRPQGGARIRRQRDGSDVVQATSGLVA